ncbi:MAG TPA: metallophosphoesterase [Treponema sp.]|jgi:Icc-related predicted phosphoesterase|nr:metallophosphoesterase [Treponema sp.]
MKFLCVSDIVDPLVYSTSVKERYDDIDAILCAGDLSLEYQDFIVSALCKPMFFIFGNHDLKDFGLYNKKARTSPSQISEMRFFEKAHGGDYISNRMLRCRNLSFRTPDGKTTPLLLAGVSGSIRYNKGEDQYTELEMKWQLIKMIPGLLWNKIRYGRYCDIFLTHASPRHIHDREDACHRGFECFNWFIKKFKPAMLIHGHIHLYDLGDIRTTKSLDTLVINAYSHLVVEYEPSFSDKGDYIGSSINILSDR